MYETRPMMTMDEWNQFLGAMVKCVDVAHGRIPPDPDAPVIDVEKELEALCVPMRERMEKAGYKDFFSYLQACIRGEKW